MSQEAFLEDVAEQYEAVAEKLKTAILHLEVGAMHFRKTELTRAGSHEYSAYGHMNNARELFDKLAKLHAQKTVPEPGD